MLFAWSVIQPIQGDVPEQYRQGLFAEPGTFDAIVRLSTTPGDPLPDSVSSPRAWAIKVIGTPEAAATLPGHEQHHTQDFLCQTGKAFGVADAEAFLKQTLFFEKHPQITSTVGSAIREMRPPQSGFVQVGLWGDNSPRGGFSDAQLNVDDLPAEVARLRKAQLHFRNEIVQGPGE